MNDRRRGCAVRREAIDDPFELIDAGNDDLHDVAVLPSHAMAFHDFRSPLRRRLNILQLAHVRPDSQNRRHRIAGCTRVDHRAVSLNHPGVFETTEAIARCRRRQPHSAPQLTSREARVVLELLYQMPVNLVHSSLSSGESAKRPSISGLFDANTIIIAFPDWPS